MTLELNQINKFISPPLKHFQAFPLVGKTESERRRYIREQIKSCIEDSRELSATKEELERVCDINHLPRFSNFNVSLSHTGDFGGFVITDKDHHCGLDIERIRRLNKSVVSRISTPREIQEFGEYYPSLWVFKESAFKALSHNSDLKLVVELQFTDFQVFNEHILTCSHVFTNGQQLQGVMVASFADDRFIYGICSKFLSTLV